MMRRRSRVGLAVAAGLCLALTACGRESEEPAAPEPEQSADGTDATDDATDDAGEVPEVTEEATAAADWLADQVEGGTVVNEQFDLDDTGLAIDVALALEVVGGHDETVTEVTDALVADSATYTTAGRDVYAGATAKALHLLQVRDAEVGDLLGQLEGLLVEDGPSAGRLSDRADDDFSTVIGQAYGARVLADADSDAAAAVAGFLLDQQCDDGWFRASFASPRASDETCEGDEGATPDNDTTALTLLVLGPVAEELDATDELDDAAAWLVSQQDDAGGLAGAEGPTVNTNTTGLAGWALGQWGETDAAAAAAATVAELQQTEGPDAGAIAYDEASSGIFDRDGLAVPQQDQVRRATSQAAPALLWLDG